MEQIKEISRTIQATRKEIVGIKSELDRCAACIAAVSEAKEALAALKTQRKDALTAAFMAGKEADTTEVDKMIKAAEKAVSSAADTAAGAEGAQDVLQARLDTLNEELEQLIGYQKNVAYVVCEQEFKAAELEYTEAAKALHAAVTKMMACNSAANKFQRFSVPLREIMKGFYTDGLSVNRGRHLPESFGLRFLSIAEEQSAQVADQLLAKLQAAGLDLNGVHDD